ncbi:DUF3817 domain-containing protein [Streptosporangium sp. NBC_01755]|uniref:DUF3817 domain-containing protein n=1 Tax=unclassified Streptosporangium TaxID=2632669 RepID=UPI002DD8DD7F|nr:MULTISPECIES: DUF3817 domain-containing protein [unclassified Streptosporangium]WSA28520.1 DUF3817 domain-containing protein [Streptosporangium sp. NBC_01810]WSC99991.1 DUF3817 domain-containing protein [Streptosporangium sp. NBC_01755]
MPIELRLFRYVALAEAFSWTGLLIGMYFKYVAATGDVGVKIFGPVHGALFVLYVVAVLVAARQARWSLGTVLVGLACSVPPLATLWFERRLLARHRRPATV